MAEVGGPQIQDGGPSSAEFSVGGGGMYFDMLRAAGFLAAIWMLGRGFRQIGLPPSIGALFAGMLLSPELSAFVPFATQTCASQTNSAGNTSDATYAAGDATPQCSHDLWRLIGNTGITLLIFEFGTHINLQKVRQVRKRTLVVGVVSTLGPMVVGLLWVLLFDPSQQGFDSLPHLLAEGCAVGVALAPTSPVVLRVLDEDDLLNTLPGQTAMHAIFLGMVTGIVAFLVLTELGRVGANLDAGALALSILIPIVASILVILVGVVLSLRVFPRLEKFIDRVPRLGRVSIQPRDEVHLVCMLLTLIVLGTITWLVTDSHLIGTFVAGMCFVGVGRSRQVWRVQLKRIRSWCVRIFYASTIGFSVPLYSMMQPVLILQGLGLGLLGGLLAKLAAALAVSYNADLSIAERNAAKRASFLTRSGRIEPSQALLGATLVARGELAFLFADRARRTTWGQAVGVPSRVAGAAVAEVAEQRTLLGPEAYTVCMWALLSCLVGAPLVLRFSIALFKKARFSKGRAKSTVDSVQGKPMSFVMNIVGRHFPGLVTEIANTLRVSGMDVFEARVLCDGHTEIARLILRPRGKTEDFDDEHINEMRGAIEQLTGDKDGTVVYFEEEDPATYTDGVIEVQAVGEIHRPGAARVISALMTEMGLYVQQGQGVTSIQMVRGFRRRIGHGAWYAINADHDKPIDENRVKQIRAALTVATASEELRAWLNCTFMVKQIPSNEVPPKPYNAFVKFSKDIAARQHKRERWEAPMSAEQKAAEALKAGRQALAAQAAEEQQQLVMCSEGGIDDDRMACMHVPSSSPSSLPQPIVLPPASPPKGTPPNGTPPNGTPPNGTPPNGTPPNGGGQREVGRPHSPNGSFRAPPASPQDGAEKKDQSFNNGSEARRNRWMPNASMRRNSFSGVSAASHAGGDEGRGEMGISSPLRNQRRTSEIVVPTSSMIVADLNLHGLDIKAFAARSLDEANRAIRDDEMRKIYSRRPAVWGRGRVESQADMATVAAAAARHSQRKARGRQGSDELAAAFASQLRRRVSGNAETEDGSPAGARRLSPGFGRRGSGQAREGGSPAYARRASRFGGRAASQESLGPASAAALGGGDGRGGKVRRSSLCDIMGGGMRRRLSNAAERRPSLTSLGANGTNGMSASPDGASDPAGGSPTGGGGSPPGKKEGGASRAVMLLSQVSPDAFRPSRCSNGRRASSQTSVQSAASGGSSNGRVGLSRLVMGLGGTEDASTAVRSDEPFEVPDDEAAAQPGRRTRPRAASEELLPSSSNLPSDPQRPPARASAAPTAPMPDPADLQA